MIALRATALAATLVLAGLPALGQSDRSHEGPSPPAGQSQAAGMMGMGGTGMMGYGPMMGGEMMPMASMMGMMGARGGAHVEGRLAFLKTELKIAEAQSAPWNEFAEAVRNGVKSMTDMHQSRHPMMSGPSTLPLPDRLALMQQAMAAHLDGLTKTAAALGKLYGVLNAEQKSIADDIVIGPMGLPMGMM